MNRRERTKLTRPNIYIFILFSYQKQQRVVKRLLILAKTKMELNISQTCGLFTTQIFTHHRQKQNEVLMRVLSLIN